MLDNVGQEQKRCPGVGDRECFPAGSEGADAGRQPGVFRHEMDRARGRIDGQNLGASSATLDRELAAPAAHIDDSVVRGDRGQAGTLPESPRQARPLCPGVLLVPVAVGLVVVVVVESLDCGNGEFRRALVRWHGASLTGLRRRVTGLAAAAPTTPRPRSLASPRHRSGDRDSDTLRKRPLERCLEKPVYWQMVTAGIVSRSGRWTFHKRNCCEMGIRNQCPRPLTLRFQYRSVSGTALFLVSQHRVARMH